MFKIEFFVASLMTLLSTGMCDSCHCEANEIATINNIVALWFHKENALVVNNSFYSFIRPDSDEDVAAFVDMYFDPDIEYCIVTDDGQDKFCFIGTDSIKTDLFGFLQSLIITITTKPFVINQITKKLILILVFAFEKKLLASLGLYSVLLFVCLILYLI